MANHLSDVLQTPDGEWLTFPGGELEGRRPRRLCASCRDRLNRITKQPSRTALCFQCYRLELNHQKSLKAAGQLDTASDARFQYSLPLEPVNARRLSLLKVGRTMARATMRAGTGRFEDRRRQAQIAARHALQATSAGLRATQGAELQERVLAAAAHAAELQLPDAWLPFVMAR